MSVQLLKTDNGYKVVAEVQVPQTVEHEFENIEQAIEKFKEYEAGTKVETTTDQVEPGV